MKFTFWNLNIDYISNKMYFYLHLRCTTLMFSFLYSCVGVLPWPPPISCFLKWCSVSYVPVSSLTLAVTFLLISTMMLSFLGPCLTLAATTLFISIMMFGFSCPCVKSYLGFHPLVTISTHWVVHTLSSKPLTFLPCIFIVSGSVAHKILWATSSSWNSTRRSNKYEFSNSCSIFINCETMFS